MDVKKSYYDALGPQVVKALRARHFEAYYCSDASAAAQTLLRLIPPGDTVGWGGSQTLKQLELQQKLAARGQTLLDRSACATAEARTEMARQALLADTFLTSANAITQDGMLCNIDGVGNRVAALCFGPCRVIVAAGMNKVAADLPAAYARVRSYAAPLNGLRLGAATPCVQTGKCADCLAEGCFCAQMVTTRLSRPAGRIRVVLIGEDLGY